MLRSVFHSVAAAAAAASALRLQRGWLECSSSPRFFRVLLTSGFVSEILSFSVIMAFFLLCWIVELQCLLLFLLVSDVAGYCCDLRDGVQSCVSYIVITDAVAAR